MESEVPQCTTVPGSQVNSMSNENLFIFPLHPPWQSCHGAPLNPTSSCFFLPAFCLTYWRFCGPRGSAFSPVSSQNMAETHPAEPCLPTVPVLTLVPDAEPVFAWFYFQPLRKRWPSGYCSAQAGFWLHCNFLSLITFFRLGWTSRTFYSPDQLQGNGRTVHWAVTRDKHHGLKHSEALNPRRWLELKKHLEHSHGRV